MRVLVSGAGGYIGGRFVEVARDAHQIDALWRTSLPPAGANAHQLDLDNTAAIDDVIRRQTPEVVLHAAYQMAVGAEPNLRWTRNLLGATRRGGARLIFLSTDLVFAGDRGWYSESDEPAPSLPYGRWKADLEREVIESGGVVARTSLVWGLDPIDDSSRRLVIDPLRTGQPSRLFADEWRTPTEVHDLAHGLVEALDAPPGTILHLAGPERISRLDFGRLLARHAGFDPALIASSSRAETMPERPADTSLALDTTRRYVTTRFRAPTDLLAAPSRS